MHSTIIKNIRIASMQQTNDYSVLSEDCLRVKNGKIVAIGNEAELVRADPTDTIIDGQRQWCLPGFIDCHTHLVHAGSRAHEFAQRLAGVDYQTINANGGGIKSTVAATRQATDDELFDTALARARQLLAEGVTTLEIKSGYGLDKDTEVRMLNTARRIGEHLGITVQRTYLGAHAMPPNDGANKYQSKQQYIDFVTQEMIPMLAERDLADAVDIFCETVGFDLVHTEQVLRAAQAQGLAIKAHVEQLSDSKGAVLAAKFGALSVDHIEYLAKQDVSHLRAAGTVAVLLPGAFYYLKETQLPPIDALREAGVPMAVATDFNPGTSPLCSLLTAANMASVLFGLTPVEALHGITVNAARALGLANKGILAVGMDADFSLWDIPSPDDLMYCINAYRPSAVWAGGQRVV